MAFFPFLFKTNSGVLAVAVLPLCAAILRNEGRAARFPRRLPRLHAGERAALPAGAGRAAAAAAFPREHRGVDATFHRGDGAHAAVLTGARDAEATAAGWADCERVRATQLSAPPLSRSHQREWSLWRRVVPPNTELNVFGSSMNGFGTKNSDMDMCITPPPGIQASPTHIASRAKSKLSWLEDNMPRLCRLRWMRVRS